MPSGTAQQPLSVEQRKRVTVMACACDRLEMQLLWEPRAQERQGPMAAFPKLWPWFAMFARLRRRFKSSARAGGGWAAMLSSVASYFV